MNAKEMFEKLGYDKFETDKYIIYGKVSFTIRFDKKYKEYFHSEDTSITVDEHKAVTQQMKDLGWIE